MTTSAADLRATANGHMQHGEPAAALLAYDRLLALTPADTAAHINRGIALNRLGRTAEALVAFERAVALDPQMAIAHSNRAQALNALDRFSEALVSAEQAVKLAPGLANAWRHLGMAQYRLERLNDALSSFREGARLVSPAHRTEALAEVAMTLAGLGRYDDAISIYGEAEAADPAATNVRYRRSHLRLLQREFATGWADYEARWQGQFADDRPIGHVTPALRRRLVLFPSPEMLRGKRVLVVAEQGIGDEIMFASVLPDLMAIAAHVACIVDYRLQGLLTRSLPGVEALAGSGPDLVDIDKFDVVLALGSLPFAFRRSEDDFPGNAYLRPATTVVDAWRKRLGPSQGRTRIGISWRGGVTRTRTGARSMELETLRPLLERDDCTFVSLQYGDVAAELAAFNATLSRPIESFPPHELDDFEQLAGLANALDMIVTVQTTLAHLAGALGQRALVMIPRRPEWRYGISATDMPWYRSLRLFRQADTAGWGPVIARIALDLDSPQAAPSTS